MSCRPLSRKPDTVRQPADAPFVPRIWPALFVCAGSAGWDEEESTAVHVFVAVQRNKLRPGAASALKNICPPAHVGGKVVPTGIGRVQAAPEKSIFRACARMSSMV